MMTRNTKVVASMICGLLAVSGAVGYPKTVLVEPDQVRSIGTDSEASSALCYDSAPPAECPVQTIPGCPLGVGVDSGPIDDLQEIFNLTPTGGGTCDNAAGDGLIGYANLGVQTGTLICSAAPLVTVDFTSLRDEELKDITAVFRFEIPNRPNSHSWRKAVLEITPALPSSVGIAPVFWPTIAVSLCDIPVNGVWTNLPSFTSSLDSEGTVSHPGDPNPVDPDCIVTNRDGTGSGLGQFDVVLNAARDNPESGHVGGIDNLSFFLGLMSSGPSQTIKIPLNEKALCLLNQGGSPPGYLELVVRMADPRGSESEGPNSTRAPLGYPDGVNILVIHDENGCTYGSSLASATTALRLEHGRGRPIHCPDGDDDDD